MCYADVRTSKKVVLKYSQIMTAIFADVRFDLKNPGGRYELEKKRMVLGI